MSFEENIKKWVALDNQIKIANEKTKTWRDEKNTLEQGILSYVETNKLANATVTISDGKLRFVTAKQTAPLTLKHVEAGLSKCIGNEKQVIQIMQFIKDSREVKYTADIKRYNANN
jgi:alkyl sulfatase BDS1-like metallo-beta-lactamase superfamily hydrolase